MFKLRQTIITASPLILACLFLALSSPVAAFSQTKSIKDAPHGVAAIQAAMEQTKAEYAHTDSLLNEYDKAVEQLKQKDIQLSSQYETLNWSLQQLQAPDTVKPKKKQ